jgi:hypothetical protein
MKNAIFLLVTLYGSCKNRRFGGTQILQESHSVTFQKTAFFIGMAVKNLKSYITTIFLTYLEIISPLVGSQHQADTISFV